MWLKRFCTILKRTEGDENVKKPFPFNNGTDEWSEELNRATLFSMISLVVSVVVFCVKIVLIFG